jgi:hypothetical protein
MITLNDIENELDAMRYSDGQALSTAFKDSMMVLMRDLHRLPDSMESIHGQLDMAWLRRDRDDYVLTIDFQEDDNIIMELIDESAMRYSPSIDEDAEEYANRMQDSYKGMSVIGADNAFNPEPYNTNIDGFDNGDVVLRYDDSHENLGVLMTIEPGTEGYDAIMKALEEHDSKKKARKRLHDDFDDIVKNEDIDGDES